MPKGPAPVDIHAKAPCGIVARHRPHCSPTGPDEIPDGGNHDCRYKRKVPHVALPMQLPIASHFSVRPYVPMTKTGRG
jgi:hypothetical protein